MHIRSRLPTVGTTIFTVMSELAHEYDALNLAQGFPDFSPPAQLVANVHKHMLAGHNQYAPMTGIPELRRAIAAKVADLYRVSVDPDEEVTVTSGATDALFTAIAAVVHPGDEVLVFDPAYDSYVPAITLAGGVPVRLSLRAPDFQVDWAQAEAAINERTRMVIVNTPHNPSGAVFSQTDIDALAKAVEGKDICVLADEVYEHIVFDEHRHISLLMNPQLREKAFVVSSFGKTYHMTGWKIAYCIAPPALSCEFRKVHQYVTFCTSAPMQYAIADFMKSSSHHLELAAVYQKKRDFFVQAIRSSRFKILPCKGTYFQLLDYSDISDEPDIGFARRLTREAGIASIPVSVFCEQADGMRLLRVCFAKDDKTLARAGEILSGI
ncbi:MAG: aminotransferase class I/II-fold pyridoxal phosphate-dependent enzyme [Gammaproteobacteria bacterium]|nr:aminotransferase class I/II-fold pyridoxal phosphate-dependent enzyme [Gammaproteobacteria bacterium]